MWEAQPYVEEISVECRPFPDSLSLDNSGVTRAHPRARKHTINSCIVFFETLTAKTLGIDVRPSISDSHCAI